MDTILPSQPVTNKQVLKRSLILYYRSYSSVALLSLLLAITIFIPRFISDLVGQDMFQGLSLYSWQRAWIFVIDLVGIGFLVAMVWRMYCIAQNIKDPFLEDYAVGAKKMFSVVVAAILQCIFLFFISFIIFGLQAMMYKHQLLFKAELGSQLLTLFIFIAQFFVVAYLATLFVFFIPLIATENKGPLKSLEYSALLVWNHWWRTFSVQITPWIIYTILVLIVRNYIDIDLHFYYVGHQPHSILSTLFNIGLFVLFIPWVPALLLVQLKDLEMRRKMHQDALADLVKVSK